MKTWGSGDIVPLILNVGTIDHRPRDDCRGGGRVWRGAGDLVLIYHCKIWGSEKESMLLSFCAVICG